MTETARGAQAATEEVTRSDENEAPAAESGEAEGETAVVEDEPEPAVVERTITVGLAYPDVSAFATLNKKFSIGDPEQQAAAVLDGWRR